MHHNEKLSAELLTLNPNKHRPTGVQGLEGFHPPGAGAAPSLSHRERTRKWAEPSNPGNGSVDWQEKLEGFYWSRNNMLVFL